MEENNTTILNDDERIKEEIITVLAKIRPFIERDGGDIRLDHYENGIVYVKLFGACVGCSALDYTLQEGVEAILKEEVPEVEKVVNVDAMFSEEDIEGSIEEN